MVRLITILTSSVALAACAAPSSPEPIAIGSDAVARLTNTDNGLELRRWTVREDPELIARTLLSFGEQDWLDAADRERLSRNGLRIVRVPRETIAAMEEALGGAAMSLQAWHGQALDWREIDERDLGGRRRAVFIDGRPQRFDQGKLQLVMRGWTLPMEDGPRFYLELVPQHVMPVRAPARVIGRQASMRATPMPTIALSALLEDGYAYVLIGESPQAVWEEVPSGEPQDPATTEQGRNSTAGPPDVTGPVASAPLTVGQLLLTHSGDRPMRELYVFVPRIPAEQFPRGVSQVKSEPGEADDG